MRSLSLINVTMTTYVEGESTHLLECCTIRHALYGMLLGVATGVRRPCSKYTIESTEGAVKIA